MYGTYSEVIWYYHMHEIDVCIYVCYKIIRKISMNTPFQLGMWKLLPDQDHPKKRTQ